MLYNWCYSGVTVGNTVHINRFALVYRINFSVNNLIIIRLLIISVSILFILIPKKLKIIAKSCILHTI